MRIYVCVATIPIMQLSSALQQQGVSAKPEQVAEGWRGSLQVYPAST